MPRASGASGARGPSGTSGPTGTSAASGDAGGSVAPPAARSSTDPVECAICGATAPVWAHKAGYPIVRCERCDTAFIPADAVPDSLERIYSADYFEGRAETGYATYRDDTELIERNFRVRLDWIEKLRGGDGPGRLLDVGTAYGVLLRAARERGWDAEGVEIAAECAAEASRLSGAPVAAGCFPDVAVEGPFDVITMIDVVEHMRDPLAALGGAHELLAPGGWLVMETGDLASRWARLMGRRWHYLDPPQHVYYFSESGLVRALRASGFEGEVRTTHPGRWVSISNGLFKLLRSSNPLIAKVPGRLYGNLWDSLLIAARK